VVVLLSLLLTAASVPFAPVARAEDDVTNVLKRISDLERAIQVSRQNAESHRRASQQFQNAIAAANTRIAQLAAKENAAENEAEQVAAEIAIAEEQLALVTLQLNETIAYVGALNAAIDEGTKLLAERERLYGQHLRQLYRQHRVTPLEMLLSSSSLADFAQRVQLMMFIARHDQQLAADIRTLKASTEEKRITAELKQAEIDGLKKQITQQRNQLIAEKRRLQGLIAQTEAALSATQWQRLVASKNEKSARDAATDATRQAADLERQKLAAEALYVQLAARLQGSSGLRTVWPTETRFATWPLSGPITSYYGARWGGFHNGLDIAGPMYAPIRAVHSGVVQAVGKPYIAFGDTAEIVIIAHATDMSTLYGHLDDRVRRPTVAPGQFVQAGQIIGYVGMTGWTTGPHLHFTTVYNRKAANPLQFLPR
jgi:murein DD-endopeptidase MepM/ murein hydrolase activator NlpD